MEQASASEDTRALLDEQSDCGKRMENKCGGSGIRWGVNLTGPGADIGVGNDAPMVMTRRTRLVMLEGAGDRKQGENQMGQSQDRGKAAERFRATGHGTNPCNHSTVWGASHSRGPTARPTRNPCPSINTVVGRARTR